MADLNRKFGTLRGSDSLKSKKLSVSWLQFDKPSNETQKLSFQRLSTAPPVVSAPALST